MATSPDDSPSSPTLDQEKPTTIPGKEKAHSQTLSDHDAHAADGGSIRMAEGEDILARQALDPALNLKMHLVNNVSLPLALLLELRHQETNGKACDSVGYR